MPRTTSLRTHLLRELEPAMERLKHEVAAMLEAKVEKLLDGIEQAFAAGLSAIASDLDGQTPGHFACAPSEAPEPSDHPDDLAPIHHDPKPSNSGSACSKCGQSGHNARSCGRAPKGRPRAAAPKAAAPMSAIAPPSRPRLSPAEIEAAKKRVAARRDRNAVRSGISAGPPPEADEPERWTADEIEAATTIAEASKHSGELPEPSSSWEVERHYSDNRVRELEF